MLAFLRREGIALDGGRIFVLTQLRVLGYVFNPVSFSGATGPTVGSSA